MNSQLNAMLPASRKVWAKMMIKMITRAVGFAAQVVSRFVFYVPVAVFWLFAYTGIHESGFDQSPITVEMLFSSFKDPWFLLLAKLSLLAAVIRTLPARESKA